MLATASDSSADTAHSVTLANLSPATTYHFRVVAVSDNGTTTYSADATFKTIGGQISITIISPADGASIAGNRVMVTGTITNPANVETGVTVNGIPAAVSNNQFAVNDVPLNAGQNTITVIATDVNGATATKSITVNAVIAENFIQLSAYPDSGTAPLEVTLRINGTFSITDSVITVTGPGAVEQLESETPEEYRYRIPTAGLYTFIATVTGPGGISYTDSMSINVSSVEHIDTILRARWDGFKNAMNNHDIDSAMLNFSSDSQEIYREIYTALKPILSDVVNELNSATINFISSDDYTAIYEILVTRNGKTYSFQLQFEKDASGIWKIFKF